jgi:dienelactone hydrolase
MTEHVVLFHSALGLRPAVRDFADRLSEAGHIVHTPDLYDGEVFEDLEHGMKKRESLGTQELAMRAQGAVADLPPGLVYAGFSMGARAHAPAEKLAGHEVEA